jgi:hypothetical protein
MEFMMSIPREEKMSGSQSMKAMWMGGSEPFRRDLEKTAASRRMKNDRENYGLFVSFRFLIQNNRHRELLGKLEQSSRLM